MNAYETLKHMLTNDDDLNLNHREKIAVAAAIDLINSIQIDGQWGSSVVGHDDEDEDGHSVSGNCKDSTLLALGLLTPNALANQYMSYIDSADKLLTSGTMDDLFARFCKAHGLTSSDTEMIRVVLTEWGTLEVAV